MRREGVVEVRVAFHCRYFTTKTNLYPDLSSRFLVVEDVIGKALFPKYPCSVLLD